MNYLERERSPRRRAMVLAGVVAFHAVLITGLVLWGRQTVPKLENLVRVDIVPTPAAK